MKTTASSIAAATSSSRPLYRAYDELKRKTNLELSRLWNLANQAELIQKKVFENSLNAILNPFDIFVTSSTKYFTGEVKGLPIKFCSGIRSRELFTFQYERKSLTIRSLKAGDCIKHILFTREVTPERLAKYILKYTARQLKAVGKVNDFTVLP